MLSGVGIGQEIERKKEAYRGNPQALQKRYQQNKQLVDLLALQQLKSEKETAVRNMQAQMQQNPATIAQQREQELLAMIKQEQGQKLGDVAKRTAGTLGQINKRAQQNMQRTAKRGLPSMAGLQGMGGLQGMRGPQRRMAQGGIVGFQSGEMVDGEAETVSVADAIAELGEEAFNYIKENPAEAALQLGLMVVPGGLAIRGGLAALKTAGVASKLKNLMRGKQPDTAPPVTRLKRGAAERDRPVDSGKQLVESGVRSDKQLIEVGTGPRGMVPYGAPNSRDPLPSTISMGRAASGLGLGALTQKDEQEAIVTKQEGVTVDPVAPVAPVDPVEPKKPVDYFAGIEDLKPVKAEFGTTFQDQAKERAGILGLAGAKKGDPTKEQARDAEQERVLELFDREGKLGVKDEQLRRMQELQQRQTDPNKLRRQRLTAGFLGAAGRGSTALAGLGAGMFNERIQQEAAERKNLADQFGIENERLKLDFDITNAANLSGMDMLKLNSQERQAVSRDTTAAARQDVELGLEEAKQQFESDKENRATKLTQATAKAAAALAAVEGQADERNKLLELYQELSLQKYEVAQEIQSASGFAIAIKDGDLEKAKSALARAQVTAAQLAELAGIYKLEEAYERRLAQLGMPVPEKTDAGFGVEEIDRLLKLYGQ